MLLFYYFAFFHCHSSKYLGFYKEYIFILLAIRSDLDGISILLAIRSDLDSICILLAIRSDLDGICILLAIRSDLYSIYVQVVQGGITINEISNSFSNYSDLHLFCTSL